MVEESETATGTSNWAAMYVFISLIPFITIMVMVYSNWADRTKQALSDEEIAAHAAIYQRYWFPWREAAAAPERSRNTQAGPSSVTSRQVPVTRVSAPAVRESSQVAPKMGPTLTVNVTASTPSPPPPPPPPKMPAPVAHPSRLEQGREPRVPFDNSANERWGEGPHGYGTRRASATDETEFQDVWL